MLDPIRIELQMYGRNHGHPISYCQVCGDAQPPRYRFAEVKWMQKCASKYAHWIMQLIQGHALAPTVGNPPWPEQNNSGDIFHQQHAARFSGDAYLSASSSRGDSSSFSGGTWTEGETEHHLNEPVHYNAWQ
jgi:hypothetical protein